MNVLALVVAVPFGAVVLARAGAPRVSTRAYEGTVLRAALVVGALVALLASRA